MVGCRYIIVGQLKSFLKAVGELLSFFFVTRGYNEQWIFFIEQNCWNYNSFQTKQAYVIACANAYVLVFVCLPMKKKQL